MPYRRRYRRGGRRTGRRRRKNTKLQVYTRKSARSQAKQIWTNSSQLAALKSKMRETYTRRFYELNGSNAAVTKPGAVFPLITPNNWTAIFNTQPVSANGPGISTHCRVNSLDIQGTMSIEEGTSVVTCDVYVLQLQEATSAVTRDNLNSNLSLLMEKTTVGTGTWKDYYYSWAGTAALEGPYGLRLNPDAFKVRGHRRFQLGDVPYSEVAADATSVTNLRDGNKKFSFKLRHPIKLQNPLGKSTTGTGLSWRTIDVDQIPAHKQLFLACFVNAVEGTEVFLNWNCTLSTNEPT